MSKINILVIASDNQGGVGFYRSSQPHKKLEEMYTDDFHVVYNMTPNFDNLEEFKMYDIIHIHKGAFANDEKFVNAMKFFKENGIVTIMDIDDHWKMDYRHPQYVMIRESKIDEKIKRNFKLFDYITTTTELFAKEIRPFNDNVVIMPNAIDPTDERFKIVKEPSTKLRVGFIMGSTHEYDLKETENFVSKLPKDILDKIEIVLCGFDLRGTIRMYHKDGSVETRQMTPKESVWYRYEKMVTNDYNIVSKDYKNFLELFINNAEYPNHENEGYRRCWTKDINHYYEHYKNIDVLLAPLTQSDFNKVKSQLKVVESAFSDTAIIASNFGPYTIDLKNIFKKGGEIDETGNAILIDKNRNHKDWAKAIEKLVKNPNLVDLLKKNLKRDICEKYDLNNVTKERAEFYKKIVNK